MVGRTTMEVLLALGQVVEVVEKVQLELMVPVVMLVAPVAQDRHLKYLLDQL